VATATERILQTIRTPAAEKPKVALDTCCVQYYISNPPVQPWADCLDPIFQAGVEGQVELYVSTVVVSELLSHVHYANRHNTGYDPELDLLAIMDRHFQVLDVDGAVARAAGRLRGSHIPGHKIGLKTPDALIGATSLTNDHALLITNDSQLAGALPEGNCIYLRDVALEWLGHSFPVRCFDGGDPIPCLTRGSGLPNVASVATLEPGSVRPSPSAKWQRILKDAHTVAVALNEPCAFFVLSEKNGRRLETLEVLFWHEGLNGSRSPGRVLKRLHEHLGYSSRTGTVARSRSQVHGLMFASLGRERARQSQPGFASKSDHQKEADAWDRYLCLWRVFRHCLGLPQTTWLFCEDGEARLLDIAATAGVLDRAGNVLGWKEER
jgi:predicted nucleic acid-binding protein